MPSVTDKVELWVRPEVFEFGVLSVLQPDKVSIDMLSRLLQYCKNNTKLSYSSWKYIAHNKMNISYECAMVIFYSCALMSQQYPDQLIQTEAELSCASSQVQRDEILQDVEVVTLELVTLLYLHRLSNTHQRAQARKASFQTLTTDPWPGHSALNNFSQKTLLEEQYCDFLKESLPELLSLLSGQLRDESTDKRKGEKRSAKDLLCFMRSAGVLSPDVIRALSFVIGASIPNDRAILDLLSVATDKHHSYLSGYLSKKKSFQKGLFEKWILGKLTWAPHGEWLCSRRGRPLVWPVAALQAPSHHKIRVSPSLLPFPLLTLTELQDAMTVYAKDDKFPCDLKISKCNKSNIYILQPTRFTAIHKCHDSRIVLGPIKGRLKVSECRNTIIISASRSIILTECRGVTIHTLTSQRPLLIGTRTQGIVMAPLNFHYPKLRQHLATAGLQTKFNLWNRPLHLSSTNNVISDSWGILSEDDFHLLPMPFSEHVTSIDERPPLLPPGLPHEYVESIEVARQVVTSLRSEIEAAKLTKEQRDMLQKTIDSIFKGWLRNAGKQREIDQLDKMEAILTYQRVTQSTAI